MAPPVGNLGDTVQADHPRPLPSMRWSIGKAQTPEQVSDSLSVQGVNLFTFLVSHTRMVFNGAQNVSGRKDQAGYSGLQQLPMQGVEDQTDEVHALHFLHLLLVGHRDGSHPIEQTCNAMILLQPP